MRKKIFALLPIALMAFGFVACDDDDDKFRPGNGPVNIGGLTGGSGQSAAPSIIQTEQGEKILLTGLSGFSMYDDRENWTLTYDNEGRITSAFGNEGFGTEEYTLGYDPFKLEYSIREDYGEYITKTTGTLNKQGYLSSITVQETEIDGNEKDVYTSTAYLDYDNEGHLIKVRSKFTDTEYEGNKQYTESGTSIWTLTWRNGNLTEINGSENGWDEFEKIRIIISYGQQPNKFKQYTCKLTDLFGIDPLSMVGLTGKGTANLPNSVYESYYEKENDGQETERESTDLHYDLNADGTIAVEYGYESEDGNPNRIEREQYTYTYSTLGSAPQQPAYAPTKAAQPAKEGKKRTRPFRINSMR